MKRLTAILISMLLILSLLTGCAKAKDAVAEVAQETGGSTQSTGTSDSASEFYGAYVEEKSAIVANIMNGLGNNPETTMNAFSFLGATLSDLYLLPASYFGMGESNVAAALTMMGSKDVSYQEDGNIYTVTYKNAEEQTAVLKGTYDTGTSLLFVGSTDGKENVFSEIYRTSFGYVAQFYSIAEDGTGTLYLFSLQGEDGSIGIVTGGDRPAALTGSESADFTKTAGEWYAFQNNTITGVTAEGTSVNFEYVPTEDNE